MLVLLVKHPLLSQQQSNSGGCAAVAALLPQTLKWFPPPKGDYGNHCSRAFIHHIWSSQALWYKPLYTLHECSTSPHISHSELCTWVKDGHFGAQSLKKGILLGIAIAVESVKAVGQRKAKSLIHMLLSDQQSSRTVNKHSYNME